MTNDQSSNFRPCRFMVQVLMGRWFMMFASFLIMTCAGATYLFGVYSKVIKLTLGYDQTTLNLLSTSKDLGANVGVLSGLIAEVTSPWFVLLIGSAMNFVGYFMIWLAVTKKIPKPAVWQMCIYICIGANSQNFANTGSLVTCIKNFPEGRGMMLGLMKGYVGLSGAFFTQLYHAIYGNDAISMILLIGWLPAVISLLFIFNIRPLKVTTRHPHEVKVLYQCLFISVVLALCLMGLTIAQNNLNFSHKAYVGGATAVCILLFSPFLITIREELFTWNLKEKEAKKAPQIVVVESKLPPPPLSEPKSVPGEIESAPSSPDSSKAKCNDITANTGRDIKAVDEEKKTSCFTNIWNKPERGEDYSILQGLLSMDMLLIFVVTFCGLGCSLTAVDNMGQIGESLGYPTRTISTFVSLISVWNYFGRVTSGFISETIVTKWKIPRPLMMTLAQILPAIADIIIAFPFNGSVYLASLLIGFSHGIQLTMLFVVISELFGLKYYSTLFNCGQLVSPLGSYVFNVQIVGRLYDREALKQISRKGLTRSMVKELTCIGKDCYRLSFIILACANLFGGFVSIILVMRTRNYYKTDIYKRFREKMEAAEKEEKARAILS